jgi:hypothetical protein
MISFNSKVNGKSINFSLDYEADLETIYDMYYDFVKACGYLDSFNYDFWKDEEEPVAKKVAVE